MNKFLSEKKLVKKKALLKKMSDYAKCEQLGYWVGGLCFGMLQKRKKCEQLLKNYFCTFVTCMTAKGRQTEKNVCISASNVKKRHKSIRKHEKIFWLKIQLFFFFN